MKISTKTFTIGSSLVFALALAVAGCGELVIDPKDDDNAGQSGNTDGTTTTDSSDTNDGEGTEDTNANNPTDSDDVYGGEEWSDTNASDSAANEHDHTTDDSHTTSDDESDWDIVDDDVATGDEVVITDPENTSANDSETPNTSDGNLIFVASCDGAATNSTCIDVYVSDQNEAEQLREELATTECGGAFSTTPCSTTNALAACTWTAEEDGSTIRITSTYYPIEYYPNDQLVEALQAGCSSLDETTSTITTFEIF